jgi:cytochrome c peroxidase
MRAVWVVCVALCSGCLSGDRGGDAIQCRPDPAAPEYELCDLSLPRLEKASATPEPDDVNPRLLRRFQPLRTDFNVARSATSPLVVLGRQLFFDERLSKTGKVSCSTCHALEQYGVTHEPRSVGVNGRRGTRNAPSVFNAAAQVSQFWDGRSPNLETQALEPIVNPSEMGMTAESTVARLQSIPGYRERFRAAFPQQSEPVTFKNVGVAVAAFEEKLATPSRWDDYLRGDRAVLNAQEKEGLRIFTSVGCMVCHTGELIGGSMYEKLGVVEPWPNKLDHGRAAVTHNAADEMVFKVPSLRNVARTGPYLHDGSVAGLADVVRMMGTYQLGVDLDAGEVAAVVAWLGSLTGELPGELTRRPSLPDEGSLAWAR